MASEDKSDQFKTKDYSYFTNIVFEFKISGRKNN